MGRTGGRCCLRKETSPALHTRRCRPDIEPLDTFYVKDGGPHQAVPRCLRRPPKGDESYECTGKLRYPRAGWPFPLKFGQRHGQYSVFVKECLEKVCHFAELVPLRSFLAVGRGRASGAVGLRTSATARARVGAGLRRSCAAVRVLARPARRCRIVARLPA